MRLSENPIFSSLRSVLGGEASFFALIKRLPRHFVPRNDSVRTASIYNFLQIVAVAAMLAVASNAFAIGQGQSIVSVQGCSRDGTNCTSGQALANQTLFVTVSGLTPAELATAKIVLDDQAYDTTVLESESGGKLSLDLSKHPNLELGQLSLSVAGNFDTIKYGAIRIGPAGTANSNNQNSSNNNQGNTTGATNTSSSAGVGGSVLSGLGQIKDQFKGQSEVARAENIGDLIVAIIKILMGLLFATAVFFIIIGGYQYVTSAGNEEMAKKGRKTLTYAIIGMALAILAYVIVSAVGSAILKTDPDQVRVGN